MSPERVIRAVAFQPDGLMIDYGTPTEDMKSNGLQAMHSLFVPYGEEYSDELDAVVTAVRELLEDALEDWPNLGPPEDKEQEDDDDDDDD